MSGLVVYKDKRNIQCSSPMFFSGLIGVIFGHLVLHVITVRAHDLLPLPTDIDRPGHFIGPKLAHKVPPSNLSLPYNRTHERKVQPHSDQIENYSQTRAEPIHVQSERGDESDKSHDTSGCVGALAAAARMWKRTSTYEGTMMSGWAVLGC